MSSIVDERPAKKPRLLEFVLPQIKNGLLDLSEMSEEDFNKIMVRPVITYDLVISSDDESEQSSTSFESDETDETDDEDGDYVDSQPALPVPPVLTETVSPQPRAPSPEVLQEILAGIPVSYASKIVWDNLDDKYDVEFERQRAEAVFGKGVSLKPLYQGQFDRVTSQFNRADMTNSQRRYWSTKLVAMIVNFRQSQNKLFEK